MGSALTEYLDPLLRANAMNLTHKLIKSHLVSGDMTPGAEIALRIDQTLTQDALGTLCYLQFEAMGVPRVRTKLSVSYVDHQLLQADFRNADDHAYLQDIAAKFGIGPDDLNLDLGPIGKLV